MGTNRHLPISTDSTVELSPATKVLTDQGNTSVEKDRVNCGIDDGGLT